MNQVGLTSENTKPIDILCHPEQEAKGAFYKESQ